MSAIAEPEWARRDEVETLLGPGAVRLASGSTALLGLTLIFLGRGVARGHRLAWGAAIALLAATGTRRTAPTARTLPRPAPMDAGRAPSRASAAVIDVCASTSSSVWSYVGAQEQIAHQLRRDFSDDQRMRATHETIYQALYVPGRGELRRELPRAQRTGRARRKPRRQSNRRQPRFTAPMVLISERPPEVADRAVPGPLGE